MAMLSVFLRWSSASASSVVVGGKFGLRVGLEELFERHGARAALESERFTGPGRDPGGETGEKVAISEFPKWRKYLISLSFRDKSSVRPVQVGGFEVNIVVHRSTAVRGRGGPPPPWESSCRTRTGPVEADGTVDAQNAPTAPWKTLRVFHELPHGLSHRITHAKPRKAPKWRWETRIDPRKLSRATWFQVRPCCRRGGGRRSIRYATSAS